MEVIVPLAWSVLPALVVLSVGGRLAHLQQLLQAYGEGHRGGGEYLRRRGPVAAHRACPEAGVRSTGLAGTFDDMFDRLERSFKAEAQFTSDASHELRTPVTVILAECETLERTAETTEDYVEGMTVIHRQAEQMSRLIGQLLHITRLEQGTQKTCMERGDLAALAEAVCEQQKMIAPEGVVLTCDAPESVEAQMDVILMTRLLNNLISNAFRYGSGGGHVRVTVRRTGSCAVLSVSDDGAGIPAGPAGKDMAALLSGGRGPQRRRGHRAGAVHGTPGRTAPRRYGGGGEHAGQGSTFTVRIPAE